MYFEHLMGLIIFVGSLLLMVLTVPWPEIKKFSIFGVLSGLGLAIVLLIIMQNWLGLWIYHKVDFLYLGRIPLILSAAWMPAEIFFAYFFSHYQRPMIRFILILFLPAVAVGIHFIQIWNHMLTYHYWNYWGTYIVSLVIHAGLALYLKRVYKIPLF
jgi:hypothetical protein